MDVRADAGVTWRAASLGLALALALMRAPAAAEGTKSFTPAQISAGAEIYARNCSPCHSPRMQDPESAADLRKFPRDQYQRFVNVIRRGQNQMPPWGDLFKPDELEALWAYVVAGER